MSDSGILERYTTAVGRLGGTPRADPPTLPVPAQPEPDADAADDHGCFGVLRGQRERAVMLELRRRTGDVLAVGYGWVERIAYDPSDGITLHLGGQSIRIRGSNLNAEVRPNVRLFEALTRHRVSWVREARVELTSLGRDSCDVHRIEW